MNEDLFLIHVFYATMKLSLLEGFFLPLKIFSLEENGSQLSQSKSKLASRNTLGKVTTHHSL